MPHPARLVFIGDSITDCGRDRSDARSYGDGYVSLIVDALAGRGTGEEVLNLGIAGDRAVDLERRWQTELIPAAPDVLTVYVGVNDMWRRFDRDDETTAEAFEATCRRLLDAARAARAPRLILVEPFLVPVRDEQRAWLDDLDGKRAVVAKLAGEYGAAFVALHQPMTDAAAEAAPADLAPDGVHPTPRGHRLIADAWLAAYDGGR
ncbi:GDSL-type esterase/lipase family protein [Agromyces sp. G08B096]|uniref:GDSL-type esterase/lipase family protein n=1 Tax=Agromyces sp. G08B096 TaxID=3156399 RepID=A0AAU7W846_9MICO